MLARCGKEDPSGRRSGQDREGDRQAEAREHHENGRDIDQRHGAIVPGRRRVG